jgi:hypothetical protein
VRATKATGSTSSQHSRESYSLSAQPFNLLSGPTWRDPNPGGGGNRWGQSMMTSFNGASFSDSVHDLRESFGGGGGAAGGFGGSFSSAMWEPRQAEYGGGTRGRGDSFASSFGGSFSGGSFNGGSFSGGGSSDQAVLVDHRRGRTMSESGSFSLSLPSGTGTAFGGLRNIMEPSAMGSGGHRRRRKKKIVFIEDMPDKFIEEEQAKAKAWLDGYEEDNRPTPMLYTTVYVPPPPEVSKARLQKRMSMSKNMMMMNNNNNNGNGGIMNVQSPRGSVIVGDDEEEMKVTLADEILRMPVCVC